jgi:hypothetical protein
MRSDRFARKSELRLAFFREMGGIEVLAKIPIWERLAMAKAWPLAKAGRPYASCIVAQIVTWRRSRTLVTQHSRDQLR